MHAQRLILPDGRISWTALDAGGRVPVVREFVLHLEAAGAAPKTVESYVRAVVKLGNALAGDGKSFPDLTPGDLDNFLLAVSRVGPAPDASAALKIVMLKPHQSTISPSRFNMALAACKRFYQFLDREQAHLLFGERQDSGTRFKGLLHHLGRTTARRSTGARKPMATHEAQAKRVVGKRLTPEQVLALIGAATTARDAFLVILLYTTGLRISEARGLHHDDVDLRKNIIWVTHRDGLENGARVKGGKSRSVPVADYVMRTYEDYISSDEYLDAFEAGTQFVFCNVKGGRRGRGLSSSCVQDIKDALVRRSGVIFNWHMLRHTHASEIIAAGYNLLDTADRLGHASPQTTNTIYKHLFDAEFRKMALTSHADLEARLSKDLTRKNLDGSKMPWL